MYNVLIGKITELVTGLDSSNLTLWELSEYFRVRGIVTEWMNWASWAVPVGIAVVLFGYVIMKQAEKLAVEEVEAE